MLLSGVCVTALTLTSRALAPLAPRCCSTTRASSPRCCTTRPPALGSLLATAENYDALLLDQFGVIHDGKAAYDGAVAAVRAVQQLGKKIVIISNSSRRKGDTVARLLSMGFGPIELDDGGILHPASSAPDDGLVPISVVTSGDLVFEGLRAGAEPPFDDLGMRCFVFGNGEDDEQYVRECGKVYSPIEQADFVLARGLFTMLGGGPDLLRDPFAPYSTDAEAAVLEAALAARPGGLPLLVANPDELRPDGKDSPMPGQLARRYAQMGGTDIRLVGKPHALIYDACRQQLSKAGIRAADARIAAVGDSLHHDVLGASRNGVDSVHTPSRIPGVSPRSALPPHPRRRTHPLPSTPSRSQAMTCALLPSLLP